MIQKLYALIQSPITSSRSGKIGAGRSESNMCFRLAETEKELWKAVIEEEFLGSNMTRVKLKELGWRAEHVMVISEG